MRKGRERPPLLALSLGMLAALFFVLPLAGLLWRAPWRAVPSDLGSPEVRTALRLSLEASLAALALCLLFGLPLAWVLARVEFPGRRLVRAMTVLPMVLPPVVGGIALINSFGRRGLVGQYLERWWPHLVFPFSTKGAVLAEAFVAMPFLVITAEAAFRSLDRSYEDAARTLGANRWTVFWRVTLPLAAPALIAGSVLCWARALGEFGATITFAGNYPGTTQTMPLAVYLSLESSHPERGIVLSLVLLAVSLGVLVGLRDRWLGVT